jgi:hypothetical protein
MKGKTFAERQEIVDINSGRWGTKVESMPGGSCGSGNTCKVNAGKSCRENKSCGDINEGAKARKDLPATNWKLEIRDARFGGLSAVRGVAAKGRVECLEITVGCS